MKKKWDTIAMWYDPDRWVDADMEARAWRGRALVMLIAAIIATASVIIVGLAVRW